MAQNSATLATGTFAGICFDVPTDVNLRSLSRLDYLELGAVESISARGGKSEVVNFTPIATGHTAKYTGTISYGQIELTSGELSGDPVQNALFERFAGTNKYSQIAIMLACSEELFFFTGYVVGTPIELVIDKARVINSIIEITSEIFDDVIYTTNAEGFILTDYLGEFLLW